MENKRKYRDFDEQFKFLIRSKTDKDIRKAFDLEVIRAYKQFLKWWNEGNTLETSEYKTRRSYGDIITDVLFIKIKNI